MLQQSDLQELAAFEDQTGLQNLTITRTGIQRKGQVKANKATSICQAAVDITPTLNPEP